MKNFYLRGKSLITIITCEIMILLLFAGIVYGETKKVLITTEDGYKITGILTKPKAKAVKAGVVLLHMYKNSKESWKSIIRHLNDKGLETLAVDMRGHGESRFGIDGEDNQKRVIARDSIFFNQMHLDAEASVRFLIEKEGIDKNRIGLIGASVGCSIAIHTAVKNKVPVSAVVVMTPGKDYLGIYTMQHIERWPNIPILILSGKEEAERGANSIYKHLQNRGAEIRIFKQEDIHGTYMFGEVEGVEELISQWIAKKLLY